MRQYGDGLMKKVLFVSSVNLYPVNAGNRVRIINLINTMREMDYDVYYVYFGASSNLIKRKMNEYLGENHCWIYEKKSDKMIKKVHDSMRRRNSSKGIYYSVDELIPNGLLAYLKKLQREKHFNIVFAEYVTSSKVLTAFDSSVLKIIDTHDVLTDRNKIFEKLQQKPTGIYLKKKQEIKGLKRADVLLAIQDNEAKIFRHWLKDKKVYVVGNQVNLARPHVAKNKNVLFVGSKNLLNRVAAEFCIKYMAPWLKSQGAVLQIVGRVSEYFPNSEQYEKLGYVKDIADIYRNARLVINPIQGGTGLNIKSIEALGYAKPLVTTPTGAKGLSQDVLIIAESKEEFQSKISDLLANDETVCELSSKAYEFACTYNHLCEKNLKKALNRNEMGSVHRHEISITVVTVCKNAESGIERTLKSVLRQNYKYFNYLVIDGMSSDNTVNIIKKYAEDSRLAYISEEDTGVYNAMNKGINMASGQYILFLNSGDELLEEDTLADMADAVQSKKADLVCGNWIKQYKNKKQYVYHSKNSLGRILIGALFFYFMANHQSILVKKEYLSENPFDESYKISADFLWYLRILKKILSGKVKMAVLDEFIVDYKMDGISAQKENYKVMIQECYRAVEQEFGFAKNWHNLFAVHIPTKYYLRYLHIREESGRQR